MVDKNTIEYFKNNITAKQLRMLLNKEGVSNKTASGTGATKRQAGDYLYNQDRGSFNALLSDIKNGENKSSWDGLYKLYYSENSNLMESGGEVKHEETYKKWKSLVNMSKSELQNFYDSKEGKEAGLSAIEAKKQGIDSGRESARWIIKMKDTPVSNWTPAMWKWASKQISFISRMSGVKGDLYDEKGNKTRKHLALLIWGHNPEKYKTGGELNSKDMSEKGINPDAKNVKDFFAHNSGSAGGVLVGNRHSEGGIKGINKSTGQKIELEGGEVVITRPAVSDNSKREFEGEMLTNREILSKINQSGGGVAILEDGGSLKDYHCSCTGHKYNYGGNLMDDHDIVKEIQEEERIKERQAYYRSLSTKSLEDGGEIGELTNEQKSLLSKFGNGQKIVLVNKKDVPGISSLEDKALIYITQNNDDHTKVDVFITHLGQKFIDQQGEGYFEEGGNVNEVVPETKRVIFISNGLKGNDQKFLTFKFNSDYNKNVPSWTSNKELAYSYDNLLEARQVEEKLADIGFLDDVLNVPVYSDTLESIYNDPNPPSFKEGGNIGKDESYYKGTKHNYENQFLINKAIEALIESVPVDQLTPEEKNFVGYYAGYGGLEKYGASGKGLLYEYFTPSSVAKKMWGLAYKHGFSGGKVLEPACGIGEFIKYAPDQQLVTGYEINEFSAKICRILYPNAKIIVKPFETVFIKNNNSVRDNLSGIGKYSLVIGNPPYGSMGGIYAGMGEKKYTKANNYIEYFIKRGLDLLESGGLLIYIIGTEVAAGGKPFLQQPNNPLKGEIAEIATLIDAYRLFNGLFETTDVLTDIVVFKKK